MKTIKSIFFIAVSLIMATTVTAQEQNSTPLSAFAEGDTVVIKRDHHHYLTGERMSRWVYNVEHTIRQVGGKRFPNGILLRGIYSWVGPDDIVNKNTNREAALAEQEAKRQAELEQARQDSIARAEARAKALQDAAEAARLDSIERAEREAAEQARRDSIEMAMRARIDSIAAVQAAAEQEKQVLPEQEAAYILGEQQQMFNCNRFTIGLRGGVASLMHDADKLGKWHAGWDVLLDLQYAHYWKRFGKKMQYGLLVGVSAGYSRSHISSDVNDQYTVGVTGDPVNPEIDYTITAGKVKEYDGQIQLEVPIMFSMIHECGFFLNVGPRLAVPVYAQYDQTIDQPNIDAYFPVEGITVHNAKITGQVSPDQQDSKGKWSASKLNVMVGAELGYEFTFKNKNSLGLGAYANYSVYTLYKNDTNTQSLVGIAGKPAAGVPAVVDVQSATDSYAKGMGYFDVGLKIAYHFNWWK